MEREGQEEYLPDNDTSRAIIEAVFDEASLRFSGARYPERVISIFITLGPTS